MGIEWKEKYPRKIKPAYSDLLEFFQPEIRELFLRFDGEMRGRFDVRNKNHRYLPTAGWAYGYGRNYGCELLSVTIRNDGFCVSGTTVHDEDSLRVALEKADRAYRDGYEERYAAICAKKRAGQIERSKKRTAREKTEMSELAGNIDSDKLNRFKWNKKVSRNDLYRLYQGEAKGLLDGELLDEVGLTFYLRCKQAKDVRECMDKGQIICHHCGAILSAGRVSRDNKPINCDCGYSYTYREYRRNCNSVNMPGGRASPVFDSFLDKWPRCGDANEKMLLIDWIVHECHVTLMSGEKGRSVCINLIEGSLKQISELLTKIAYA